MLKPWRTLLQAMTPDMGYVYLRNYKSHQDYNWLKEQCCENLMNIAQIGGNIKESIFTKDVKYK